MKFFLSSPSLFSLMPLLMTVMSLISRLSFKHLNYPLIPLPTYTQSVFITAFHQFLPLLSSVQAIPLLSLCLEYSNSLLAPLASSRGDPVQRSCCCHINLLTAPFQSSHSSPKVQIESVSFFAYTPASPLCYSFYFFCYLCIYGLAFSTTILLPSLPVKIVVILQGSTQLQSRNALSVLRVCRILFHWRDSTLDAHFTLCLAFLLLLKCFLLSNVCFKFGLPCRQR